MVSTPKREDKERFEVMREETAEPSPEEKRAEMLYLTGRCPDCLNTPKNCKCEGS